MLQQLDLAECASLTALPVHVCNFVQAISCCQIGTVPCSSCKIHLCCISDLQADRLTAWYLVNLNVTVDMLQDTIGALTCLQQLNLSRCRGLTALPA